MGFYRKELVFKPIINQLNIVIGFNLYFTRFLNTSYPEMEGKRICHLFSIFNLTCCNFVTLKEYTFSNSFQSH